MRLAIIFLLFPVSSFAGTQARCIVSSPTSSVPAIINLVEEEDQVARGERIIELDGYTYRMRVITDVRTSGDEVKCGEMGELYFLKGEDYVFLGSSREQYSCDQGTIIPPTSLEMTNYDLDIAVSFHCQLFQ